MALVWLIVVSLLLTLFLEDFSRQSITKITSMVKNKTNEIVGMIIMRMEVEETIPWWW